MFVIFKSTDVYISQLLFLLFVQPYIQILDTCLLMYVYVYIKNENILLAISRDTKFFSFSYLIRLKYYTNY